MFNHLRYLVCLVPVILSNSACSVSADIDTNPAATPPDPATVTDISGSSEDGIYRVGDSVSITATFSKAVTVTGTPKLELETGSTNRYATFTSGSNSTTLVFSYTVQSGDLALDLDYASTTALELDGGTIYDADGVEATLTLPSPGTEGSMAHSKNWVVRSGWTSSDGGNPTGLNVGTSLETWNPSLAYFQSKTYLAWSEINGSGNGQIYVKRLNGTTWESVGSGSLNYDTNRSASLPQLFADNSKLYLSWQESSASANQIRVRQYDGTDWSFIDGGGATGINKDTALNASAGGAMAMIGDALYVTFHENNGSSIGQIRVKKYEGGSWSFIDGNGADGLNKDTARLAQYPQLQVAGGTLYLTWYERNASNKRNVRVASYNGTTWSFVDGNGANGLNKNTSYDAYLSKAKVLGSNLYLTWYEKNASNISQVRVVKYDGTSWSFIDGDGVDGLNRNVGINSSDINIAADDNNIYLTWSESGFVRVSKYDGSQWTNLEDSSSQGLNYASAGTARTPSILASPFGLFVAWPETDGTGIPYQVRVKAY